MSKGPLSGINRKARNWIAANVDLLQVLIDADEPLPLEAWPEELHGRVLRGAEVDAIRTEVDEDTEYHRHQYDLTPKIEAAVEKKLEDRQTLPCGHFGVRNLGGGRYTCSYDGCDAVHGRTATEEAIVHA